MSASFQAALDKELDYYAQENSSWTEVRDGKDGIEGANLSTISVYTTDVVFSHPTCAVQAAHDRNHQACHK